MSVRTILVLPYVGCTEIGNVRRLWSLTKLVHGRWSYELLVVLDLWCQEALFSQMELLRGFHVHVLVR